MPSSVWNHAADKSLLLCIIEIGSLSKIDWPKVSTMMGNKNYTFSHEACRQHFQKIRKESRNGDGSAASTPSKLRAPRNAPASGRQSKVIDGVANDDDEENLFATPTKKRKMVTKKEEEDDEVDFGGFAGQNAAQVKFEDDSRPYIDLENDDIYDDEA